MMKTSIRRLAYIVLAALVLLCLYLAVIPLYVDRVAKDGTAPADPRVYARESKIKRGDILDRHGAVLAQSLPKADGGYIRTYPQGVATSHVVGYYSPRYGSAGLEKSMAATLQGLDGDSTLTNLRHRILGEPGQGNDIILTIDAKLQQHATNLMQGKKGAAVALNPTTGEILAMVSYPNYDPNQVAVYMDQSGAPLLNRATQGAYPPGSIFKIITAASVLTYQPSLADENITCDGQLKVGGFVLRDYAVHGTVDLAQALSKSCNVAFARYGLALGEQKLAQTAKQFGVGVNFDFPLPQTKSIFSKTSGLDQPALASTAMGQGELLISPLQAAVWAAAVANDGVIMQPYLVAGYQTPNGVMKENQPRKLWQAMSPEVAATLKTQMAMVVKQGTGSAAAIPGVEVAGKTGSAENPHGLPHAWFVAFAPVSNPQVAVAVLVENAGSGGANSAPIAREIMRQALAQ